MASSISLIAANLVERIEALMPSTQQRHCLVLAQNLLSALSQKPSTEETTTCKTTDNDAQFLIELRKRIAALIALSPSASYNEGYFGEKPGVIKHLMLEFKCIIENGGANHGLAPAPNDLKGLSIDLIEPEITMDDINDSCNRIAHGG